MSESVFVEDIKKRLDEFNNEYKQVYKEYAINEEEQLFIEFLDDIWKPRYDDEQKNKQLYDNGNVAVLFQGLDDKHSVFQKVFPLRKLHPLREATAPLWYILYRIAKNNDSFNVFMCPNIMYKDRDSSLNESNVIASNAYFIDIDEVQSEKPPYNMTYSDITSFMNDNFEFYTELSPKYILVSGRGFHLYFIQEKTEKLSYYKDTSSIRQVHKWLTKDLIGLYGADKVCHNLNRYMRLPLSRNHKINIKSRLYKTEDDGKHNISEMLEVVKKYKVPVKSEISPREKEQPKSRKIKQKTNSTGEKENGTSRNGNGHGIYRLCQKRQRDLEKWISMHQRDVKGRRHNFFWLYVNNMKNMKNQPSYIEVQAKKINRTLLEPLSDNELEAIVHSSEKVYRIKNETMGELLSITDEDNFELEGIYTLYTEESRKQARAEEKERKRQERLKKNNDKRMKNWEKYFEYMRANPDSTYQQMAEEFSISTSYCNKIRSAFRKNAGIEHK